MLTTLALIVGTAMCILGFIALVGANSAVTNITRQRDAAIYERDEAETALVLEITDHEATREALMYARLDADRERIGSDTPTYDEVAVARFRRQLDRGWPQ